MIEKTKKVNILVIILIVLLVGALGFGGYTFYKLKTGKTITVSGKAEVQITNQISSYSVTVEKHDKDKSKAVEAATAGSQIVVETAKTLGIEAKDIKTQNLNVYQREDPYYEDGVTKYKPADWYASYTVDITLRDLTKSETLTAALVKIENTTMWGPNLRVDESKIDEAAILSQAIEDARKKAEKLAISSGKKLGEIVSIVEGSAYDGYPLVKATDGMGGGGGGFAVEPGSSTVSKSVTVTFKLK
jgi:uncharacterized protein YggE